MSSKTTRPMTVTITSIHRLPVPILAAQDHPACPQVVLATYHGGYRDASITMVAVTSSAVCGSGVSMPAWSYNRVTPRREHARRPSRPVNAGNTRSLQDNLIHRLTCGHTG